MTANELADKLRQEGLPYVEQAATMLRQQQDKLTKYELRHAEQRKRIDELETMLRQQQAEIEALKADNTLLQEIFRLQSNPNLNAPKRIASLVSRLTKHALWRYHKDGEIDQFSYVEWNDEDAKGYEVTMFLPMGQK